MNRDFKLFLGSFKCIRTVAFGVFLIIVWEMACRIFNVSDYLLPSPSTIFFEVGKNISYLSYHLAMTILEAIIGLVIATITGFILACIFVYFNNIENLMLPYFVASQSIPIVAIAPLFILWFGNGLASKIAMATLMCFFPITVSTSRGLRLVSTEQIDLFRVHAATRWKIFTKLRLPVAIGQIFTGIRVSSALAMIGAIVAEYSGADRGIGYVIMQSTYRLETPLLFSGIILTCLFGFMFFLFVVFVESFFLKKYIKCY